MMQSYNFPLLLQQKPTFFSAVPLACMQPPILQIVLPCFHPQEGWQYRVLERYLELVAALPIELQPAQLILVNDGNRLPPLDPEALKWLQQQLPDLIYQSHTPNRGKGYALRQGVQAATAPYVLYTDIDFPYTAESTLDVASALLQGQPVVVGVRPPDYYAQVPPFRRWLSRRFRAVLRRSLHLPVDDTQAGLKAFDRRGREVFLRTRICRYLFDLEFIYLCHKHKLTVIPVPVQLRPGVQFTNMRLRILLQESLNFLRIWLRD